MTRALSLSLTVHFAVVLFIGLFLSNQRSRPLHSGFTVPTVYLDEHPPQVAAAPLPKRRTPPTDASRNTRTDTQSPPQLKNTTNGSAFASDRITSWTHGLRLALLQSRFRSSELFLQLRTRPDSGRGPAIELAQSSGDLSIDELILRAAQDYVSRNPFPDRSQRYVIPIRIR